jgi:hypothetical protein
MPTRFLPKFLYERGQANQCVNSFELVFQVDELCTNSSCCLYQGLYTPPIVYLEYLGVPTPTTHHFGLRWALSFTV